MPCTPLGDAIICTPTYYTTRRILHCPTCQQRRRFICHDEAWYGITKTCCAYGDTWSDGERRQRPARRGWRKEAATKATKEWINTPPTNRADYEQWFRDQIG